MTYIYFNIIKEITHASFLVIFFIKSSVKICEYGFFCYIKVNCFKHASRRLQVVTLEMCLSIFNKKSYEFIWWNEINVVPLHCDN